MELATATYPVFQQLAARVEALLLREQERLTPHVPASVQLLTVRGMMASLSADDVTAMLAAN